MIDHISLSVADLQRSRDFYVAALKPLGYEVIYDIKDVEGWGMNIKGCSIGENKQTRLWLDGDSTPAKAHIAFGAINHQQVDDFYKAGLAAGGKDNGAPGIREQYSPTYYAAFVYDPDGNNIEIVCRA